MDGGGQGEFADGAPARNLMLGGVEMQLGAIQAGLRRGCDDVTGFELWQPATAAACEALEELWKRQSPIGDIVLELGCGLGALGIYCAMRRGGHVVLTDKELPVLRLAMENAQANGSAIAARCEAVAFDFTRGRPPWRPGIFDQVVASDVLFLDKLARPLYNAFEALLASEHRPQSHPRTAVLGHEVRRAVFRGPDGKPCVEPEDSALKILLEAAGPHACCTKAGKEIGCKDDAESAQGNFFQEAVSVVMQWALEPQVPEVVPASSKRQRVKFS